jgi:cysteine desulfuration protein SufE
VTSGTGHGDFYRSFHDAIRHKQVTEQSRSNQLMWSVQAFPVPKPEEIPGILRVRFAPLRMTRNKSPVTSDRMYPAKLKNIINLFESLPEDERRETLVSYADNAKKQEPRNYEKFDLVDVRKDEECTDTVGVYLHVDEDGKAHIRMTLGPEVQTLTRAMTAVLCKGLDGSTPQEILDLPSDFVTRIVGTELVRLRSQTVYYVLTRIKSICKVYLDRQRMAQVA